MRILITGASGLIGSALAPFLAGNGHKVVTLPRLTDTADVSTLSWSPSAGRIKLAGAGQIDAVIHLAGESIARRWTPAVKARIRGSRIDGTRLLSEVLARQSPPPEVLISASATGFYGNRGGEFVDERTPAGHDFLAEVCRDWEAATLPASQHGIRVVNLRLGIVLTPRGGALGKMLPAFRLGLGGKLGSGRHYWSWIGLQDLLNIFQHMLANKSLAGPVNAVSPNPATNQEFTKTLGKVLARPTVFSVPSFAVNVLFGEMGQTALLGSCRVRPARLQQAGFEFKFPDLEMALTNLLGRRHPG